MDKWEYSLDYLSYGILVPFPSGFNWASNSWIRNYNLAFDSSIKCLAKGIELWPFNESIGQIPYDNETNQSFDDNRDIEVSFQDLSIKLLLLARSSSLVVILPQLQINHRLVLTNSYLNRDLVIALYILLYILWKSSIIWLSRFLIIVDIIEVGLVLLLSRITCILLDRGP
jgi:hypothetical protein